MSIVKMSKVNIIFPQKHQRDILSAVQDFGVMQLENFPSEFKSQYNLNQLETPAEWEDVNFWQGEVNFAIKFLSKHDSKHKKTLKERIEKLRPLFVSKKEQEKVIENFDYKQIVGECKTLEDKLNKTRSRLKILEEEKEIFSEWENLHISLKDLHNAELQTKMAVGSVLFKQFAGFESEIKKINNLNEVQKVAEGKKTAKVVVVYLKVEEEAVRKIFSANGFKEASLIVDKDNARRRSGRVKDELHNINREIEKDLKEVEKDEKMIKKLTADLKKLKIIYDYLSSVNLRKNASDKILSTKYFSFLQGWIPREHINVLQERLNKISSNVSIVNVETAEGETPPTLLKNNKAMKPFQEVVNLYGMPNYFEIDPTSVISFFFILFLGFNISDAGYGIVMVLMFWLIIKITRPPKEKQGLYRLLIYGGISTIIMGALMGGWFGVSIDKLPEGIFKTFFLSVRAIDPATNPVKVLIIALAIGVIHLLTALLTRLYMQIRDKNYKDALFGTVTWLIFLPTLITLGIVSQLPPQYGYLIGYLKYLAIFGAVAILLGEGRNQKTIIGKLGTGLFGLYSTVGWLSDMLSYSRLLALGLCTGIIAMVINTIAGLARGIPYVGFIVMVIILLAGHAFNIAINILGGFIHAARLQFVEFFTKFLGGGGKDFKPFRKVFKYSYISPEQ